MRWPRFCGAAETVDQTVPYIVGMGVASAAAPSLRSTLEALQSRQTLFTKAPSFVGPDYKPLVCAFRDPDLNGSFTDRLETLLVEALDDLAANEAAPQPGPLILCLPERAVGETPEGVLTRAFAEHLVRRLTARLGENGAPSPTQVIVSADGGPGAVMALKSLGPQPDYADVVLCTVDSYACRARLGPLLSAGRLFSNSTPWGFVPGEGAVALRLRYAQAGHPGIALTGLAHESESAGEMDGQDSAFEALSDCIQHSASTLQAPAGILTTGWNNSRYRASEFSYALHRLPKDAVREDFELVHPALRFGEIGASSLPMATVIGLAEGQVSGLHCTGSTWKADRVSWATVEFQG